MNQKMTRRRFGQLATAGTAVAGLAYFANKTFAKRPNSLILGISPGRITTTTANSGSGLVLQSLDMVTGLVQTVANPQFLADGTTPILQSNEELSGFTALANGTLVAAITPVSRSKKQTNATRLTLLGKSPIAVPVSGLNEREKLAYLVGTNDGGLLGLVLQKNNAPPVRLVNVNLQTGQITNNTINLPANQRFLTLAQCPDGSLYTITTGEQGNTSLVKLDQAQQQAIIVTELSFNGRIWNSGLQSLVCSPAGQFLAFGALRYVSPNTLYSVNASTATLTALTPFKVAKITMAPTTLRLG